MRECIGHGHEGSSIHTALMCHGMNTYRVSLISLSLSVLLDLFQYFHLPNNQICCRHIYKRLQCSFRNCIRTKSPTRRETHSDLTVITQPLMHWHLHAQKHIRPYWVAYYKPTSHIEGFIHPLCLLSFKSHSLRNDSLSFIGSHSIFIEAMDESHCNLSGKREKKKIMWQSTDKWRHSILDVGLGYVILLIHNCCSQRIDAECILESGS